MTAIVGILCKDGVVIGADSAATFTAGTVRLIEQKTRKIDIVNDRYIIASTGQIGLSQRVKYEVEQFLNNSSNRRLPAVELCRHISVSCIKNFGSTSVKTEQIGSLLAFPVEKTANLCEFDVHGFQQELKDDKIWYVSMGSGQILIDPLLGLIRKLFWNDGMPLLSQGIFSVVWCLTHAIEVNAGGIAGPIDVAVLEQVKGELKARLLSTEEIQEHDYNLRALEEHISSFRRPNPPEDVPDIPSTKT